MSSEPTELVSYVAYPEALADLMKDDATAFNYMAKADNIIFEIEQGTETDPASVMRRVSGFVEDMGNVGSMNQGLASELTNYCWFFRGYDYFKRQSLSTSTDASVMERMKVMEKRLIIQETETDHCRVDEVEKLAERGQLDNSKFDEIWNQLAESLEKARDLQSSCEEASASPFKTEDDKHEGQGRQATDKASLEKEIDEVLMVCFFLRGFLALQERNRQKLMEIVKRAAQLKLSDSQLRALEGDDEESTE